MEFEQIVKRLDWLDNERRKDKEVLSALKEQMASLKTTVNANTKQIKDLSKQMSEVSTAAARMNQFGEMLAKQRADLNKAIDNLAKNYRQEADANKRHQAELEGMSKAVADIRAVAGPAELKKKFREHADETLRLTNNLEDLRRRIEEVLDASQEVLHNHKLTEEARQQDLNRLTEFQGEVTALRKRSDENREKSILHEDSIHNIERRLTELFTNESGRNQAQAAFLEEQARAQLERDQAWREWRDKYQAFQKEAENMTAQVQNIDDTLRAAKRAQETYADLNTKLERRINEVMELQRLAEDRLRQEWVSFKADDQKRWTGYALSTEEATRDLRKDFQKMEKTVSALEDLSQTMQDQLHQTTDTTEQQLQELMNIVHQWMTSYERIMGHNKKVKK
ncbi:MAG: hypothetical protein A2Z03_07635 [Chloroflexi bacterium RBG_16_56_8]|nr:MAG: hypothetical protein A2Z03_07635 [Chloroflexi bacterium RBG_16_56_8]